MKELFESINEIKKQYIENTSLKEASETTFEELSPEEQKFLTDNDLVKNIDYIWDGVHGKVIDVSDQISDSIRLEPHAINKLLRSKGLRWLEVTAIGFGKGY